MNCRPIIEARSPFEEIRRRDRQRKQRQRDAARAEREARWIYCHGQPARALPTKDGMVCTGCGQLVFQPRDVI